MKVLRFALAFAFGTLLSRILGFVRDATIAFFFGASHVADAFFVAFRLPNSLRRILGEGGLNASFVPLYTQTLERGKDKEFLSSVLGFLLLSSVLVSLMGSLLSEQIVTLIAPGLRDAETFELAVFMARFLFLYVLFTSLYALLMGIFNVRGRFFLPAFAQGLFNLTFSATVALTAPLWGYMSLVAGVLVGGVAQVIVFLPYLVKDRVPLGISLKVTPEVKLLFVRMVPALGGFGVSQLSILVDTFFASFLGTGAVSYLYYANRLYQLPFGVISVAVANSLLSVLSKSGVNRSEELTFGFRFMLLFALPSAVGLFVLAEEIIAFVYGRGNFTERDVIVTAQVLRSYSVGLLLLSSLKVISSLFYSEGDTKTPLKALAFTLFAEALLGALLAFGIGMDVRGLALGSALAPSVGFLYLLVISRERPFANPIFLSLLKTGISSFIMGLALWKLKGVDLTLYLKLPLLIFFGACLYFALLFVLREDLALRAAEGFVKKLVKS